MYSRIVSTMKCPVISIVTLGRFIILTLTHHLSLSSINNVVQIERLHDSCRNNRKGEGLLIFE